MLFAQHVCPCRMIRHVLWLCVPVSWRLEAVNDNVYIVLNAYAVYTAYIVCSWLCSMNQGCAKPGRRFSLSLNIRIEYIIYLQATASAADLS